MKPKSRTPFHVANLLGAMATPERGAGRRQRYLFGGALVLLTLTFAVVFVIGSGGPGYDGRNGVTMAAPDEATARMLAEMRNAFSSELDTMATTRPSTQPVLK